MSSLPGAVIFDFDGVICDSEPLHYKALNKVFNLHGVDVPEAVHREKYLGFNDLENIRAVNEDYDMGLDDGRVDELMKKKSVIFAELASREARMFDGVEQFVSMLKQEAIETAICSGALLEDIEIMLDGTAISDSFDIIVAADHVTKGKPDPEGYLLCLEKLNEKFSRPLTPAECVVVEDSRWGLEAARSAGMHTIAVTTTYDRDQLTSLADMVVENLGSLDRYKLGGICG
jgi:beta-phosphoglucomutase